MRRSPLPMTEQIACRALELRDKDELSYRGVSLCIREEFPAWYAKNFAHTTPENRAGAGCYIVEEARCFLEATAMKRKVS